MSPKENNKKRLNKKSPKGASCNSVPLQAAVPAPGSHPLATGNILPPSESPLPGSSSRSKETPRAETSCGTEGESKANAAVTRKGWSIARRLLGEFWENCKIKPDLGILSGYAIRSLQAGFREIDLISAFERALHQCHGHATDAGEIWEASSTVHRAEALLRRCQKRWKPLSDDERVKMRTHIKQGLVGVPVEKEAKESTVPLPASSRNSSRKEEIEPVPLDQWPSPMAVRGTFNAIRRAAGLPTRPMDA